MTNDAGASWGREVEAFLTHLALAGEVAAATRNQALLALLFLYRERLETDRSWLGNVVRAWCGRGVGKMPGARTGQAAHNLAVLKHINITLNLSRPAPVKRQGGIKAGAPACRRNFR